MSVNPLAPGWLAQPVDANALDAGIWPAQADRAASGAIEIAGVPATALHAAYGTPLYVFDEQAVLDRAAGIRDAFTAAFASAGAEVAVYYAGKAFLSVEVARWMADAGLRIDVCTGGELAVVLTAGVDPARIGFHGNNKSLDEIDRAVEERVGAIVIDSLVEIERVAAAAERHGRTQPVRLRINSGVHASTHEYLATAREDQKFGIPIADAAEAVARIRSHAQLRFLGLHSHIGSQIFESAGFGEAARRLLALHAELLEGGDVPELNLGGGFGIAYTSVDRVTPIERIARELADAVVAGCAELGIPVPRIAIEPGRYIVGPAGVTLYEVGTVKDVVVSGEETAVRRYVSVDGGMSDNLRTALYGADYTVRIANRRSDTDPALVRVAGKHCESGDIVVRDDYLPGDVQPGDLLAVPATGAYCWSLASNYNYVGRPAVVAVRDGRSRVLIRRETEHDLLRRDAGYSSGAEEAELRIHHQPDGT
ncbi:diaminopimelate decarboxylase [Homoserinibacter sp. GY 40078]|uniref:diaminopimelate decarboxylase n=1 Tax=Homoserinibacter sp. GY 40078 TaxID=2603275 RepID=UPI0011CC57AE|nr:diaminopimelate decarboxylase [Homoserinibacter sp. GY 40078]TXK17246.1 diaminopimelate decarboxylase [Homoserinibacter sp. GY 40078]